MFSKDFKRRDRYCYNFRNASLDHGGGGNIRNYIKNCFKSIKGSPRRNCKKYHKGFKGFLKDTAGYMISLEFLLYLTIFIFIIFGGVDYYLTEVQHNIVEEATNFYLSKMKFAGTLYNQDRMDLVEELSGKGFKNITISAKDGYGNELNSDTIIVRNVENLPASTLYLEVKAEPHMQPFILGKILGAEENDQFYFKVDRRSISERSSH